MMQKAQGGGAGLEPVLVAQKPVVKPVVEATGRLLVGQKIQPALPI